jgi:GntR family transcriptional repressor for pyruvate dehydrogenase complex
MKKAIPKIEKISITDEVVKRIRDFIKSGEYAVGDKLPTEMELREQLGVGRSTIREAFRVLQAIGLIELRSGRGAFVKGQNDNTYETIKRWFVEKEAELSELMEVRMAIEPIAVKLAIQRGRPEQIEQLREIHDAFKKAVERRDAIDLATLDESFHNAIVEASNNGLLIKIGRLIADAFVAYRTRSFAVPENMTHALEPHERIMNAILRKDAKSAIQGIQKHLEVSLEDMSKVVSK